MSVAILSQARVSASESEHQMSSSGWQQSPAIDLTEPEVDVDHIPKEELNVLLTDLCTYGTFILQAVGYSFLTRNYTIALEDWVTRATIVNSVILTAGPEVTSEVQFLLTEWAGLKSVYDNMTKATKTDGGEASLTTTGEAPSQTPAMPPVVMPMPESQPEESNVYDFGNSGFDGDDSPMM